MIIEMEITLSTPSIRAVEYKPAIELIHYWGISQWRATAYLEAVGTLSEYGNATDKTIATVLGGKRTAGGVNTTIRNLVNIGLVKVVGQSKGGSIYKLTGRGQVAFIQYQKVVESWKVFKSNVEAGISDTTSTATDSQDYPRKEEMLLKTVKAQANKLKQLEKMVFQLKSELNIANRPMQMLSFA